MARRAIALLLVLLAGAGTLLARQRLDELAERQRREDPLLYLPNGKYLELASLGHASVVADWIYIWAVQFYSDYERSDRYRYVEHVFSDVISELDPHYVDPYWLGALIMTVEADDLEGGLRLLDKGFANNPDQWVLPYLAGWECYHAGRLERAGEYFERAAAVPGSPPDLRRIRAGLLARTGNVGDALQMWLRLLQDPTSDDRTRAIARRHVRTLTVRLHVDQLGQAVAMYESQAGQRPSRLADLVAAGIVLRLPVDPDGRPYAYDPATGRVSSAAQLLGGGR
jgi:tetratricopeptide (TPR) repeat protein